MIEPKPVAIISHGTVMNIDSFQGFRNLINVVVSPSSVEYLDESNILIVQELGRIVKEMDQFAQEEGCITLNGKDSMQFRSLLDDLDKLRIDIYNSRLL